MSYRLTPKTPLFTVTSDGLLSAVGVVRSLRLVRFIFIKT